MLYPDGTKIMVGDELELFPGVTGRVVCELDENIYDPDFPKEEWSNLETGIIILTHQNGGIVRFDKAQTTFRLLKRQDE